MCVAYVPPHGNIVGPEQKLMIKPSKASQKKFRLKLKTTCAYILLAGLGHLFLECYHVSTQLFVDGHIPSGKQVSQNKSSPIWTTIYGTDRKVLYVALIQLNPDVAMEAA
jgi:hypothetical protein